MEIYNNFDLAATTRPTEKCVEIYKKYAEQYYNPSALYLPANSIKQDIESARVSLIKKLFAAENSQFLFLPSATIANNLVLRTNIVRKDKKYLISAGEHSSVYFTALALIKEGYDISFIPLESDGTINCNALLSMMSSNVALVSIIHTSNESGVVNDLKNIILQLRKINPRVIVHSDGVQSINKILVNLNDLDVDYYTISGHKIGTYRGISALYVRHISRQLPYIYGGGQEMKIASGTENVAGIMALADAVDNNVHNDAFSVRDAIIDTLIRLDDIKIITAEHQSPYIILLFASHVRGETIIHMMADRGYLLGTGSACNSKDHSSRIAKEMGIDKEYIAGELRISFDIHTTTDSARQMANSLIECISEYRRNTK